MRKAAWTFIILIHFTSYGWSAPKIVSNDRDHQHTRLENIKLSVLMEMTLPEEKFISENSDNSKQNIIHYRASSSAHLPRLAEHPNFIFNQPSSPPLYLRIRVFRN